jgi:hypothetical protein
MMASPTHCPRCPDCGPSPWRDFSEEQQLVMRNLLRRIQDLRGKRFEVRMLRDDRIEIAEVSRQVIVGRRTE